MQPLQLLLSEFPGGLSGLSLLLLRAVLGGALFVQGAYYVGEPNPGFAGYMLGLAALAAGILLVIGFLTPFTAMVTGVGVAGVFLSLLPTSSPSVFDSKTAMIFAATMLLTILGAGPGRFSVDARMFGRREIVIPPLEFPQDQEFSGAVGKRRDSGDA
jgi:uncharacterized membrane protein YphA (DoxX/SURF4 family)